MFFWHLLRHENAHIRQVCCGFAAFDQLQPTLRSESRGGLHTMPSREEETPPLWWGKITLVIQFL